MQPPPPTGLTGKAPPPAVSPGNGGAGTTLGDGGDAPANGSPTPPSASASTTAPPHNAATVRPLRLPMTPNSRYSEPDVQTQRDMTLRRHTYHYRIGIVLAGQPRRHSPWEPGNLPGLGRYCKANRSGRDC